MSRLTQTANTLAARMGFQDPDLKTPEHDLACQYVRECPEAILTAAGIAFSGVPEVWLEVAVHKAESRTPWVVGFVDAVIQYDKVNRCLDVTWCVDGPTRHSCYTDGEYVEDHTLDLPSAGELTDDVLYDSVAEYSRRCGLDFDSIRSVSLHTYSAKAYLYVEVKIAPTTMGETLRQIQMYRANQGEMDFCLISKLPISIADADAYRAVSIQPLQLAAGFEVWKQERAGQAQVPGV